MRVKTRTQASKTALRICYKSSSEYLEILVVVAGDFGLGSLLGCLEIFDLGSGEDPRRATEGVTEEHSCWEQPQSWTEIILI